MHGAKRQQQNNESAENDKASDDGAKESIDNVTVDKTNNETRSVEQQQSDADFDISRIIAELDMTTAALQSELSEENIGTTANNKNDATSSNVTSNNVTALGGQQQISQQNGVADGSGMGSGDMGSGDMGSGDVGSGDVVALEASMLLPAA